MVGIELQKTTTKVVCSEVRAPHVVWGNIQGAVYCGATIMAFPSHTCIPVTVRTNQHSWTQEIIWSKEKNGI